MSYVEPRKTALRTLTLAGQNLILMAMNVRIFETVCKPYITGQITVRDTEGFIESLGIVGGEPVSVAWQSPPNDKIYEQSLRVLSIAGETDQENLKAQIYKIDIIGELYFQDRGQMVQSGHKNQTGSDAIQQVFSKYLGADALRILSPAISMIQEPLNITNRKPITAIHDIMKTLAGGAYKAGNALFFRDAESNVLASLEDLFKQGAQETFIQKETWGANFFDPMVYNAIIYAHALQNRAPSGGRGGLSEVSAAVSQGKQIFDWTDAASKFDLGAAIAGLEGSIGSMASGFLGQLGGAGGIGGLPNIMLNNALQFPKATAPHTKTAGERALSANARGGPQLEWKVPMQSGINCTVGKGATCQLIPSGADLGTNNQFNNSMSGLYLVTDLVHELMGDNQQWVGTTTFKGIKSGFGT